jgi:hypothetical protein
MKTKALTLVPGHSPNSQPHHWHGSVEHAVTRAIRAGFRVGRRVRIGGILGCIIGYNIGHFGRFSGASYPLLVKTEFGVAKCSVREVAAA